MTALRIATSALAVALGVMSVSTADGLSQGAPETAVGQLRSVSDFDGVSDGRERSQRLFEEAARVITDPRCMNCHPSGREPTQGDDMHAHVPPMKAGESGIGPDGLACAACHGPDNRGVLGSRIKSIPGNPHWSLAPAGMGWQGFSIGEICRQIKDPARNGGRSLEEIHRHMAEDHLVGWAWHPGAGRRPAPGTQAEFGALVAAWIATGAECPQ